MSPEEFVDFLMEGKEEGLEIRLDGRDIGGRGVFTTRKFEKGNFVCKYKGDLISVEEADARCDIDPSRSIFQMKVERHRKKFEFVVDASDSLYAETFGRNINHDKEDVNIIQRVIDIPKYGTTIVYFEALRDIEAGEELAYHYQDNRRGTDLKTFEKKDKNLEEKGKTISEKSEGFFNDPRRSVDLKDFKGRTVSSLGKSGKTSRFYKSVRKPVKRKNIKVD